MRFTSMCWLSISLAFVPIYAIAAPRISPAVRSAEKTLEQLPVISPLEAAYREGVSAYEDGQYVAALKLLRAPAEQGHTEAQFTLGLMYVTGRGTPKNVDYAIQWWQTAAAQRHIGSLYNLGWLYANGNGVEQDYATARMYWHLAASNGDALAQFQLGVLAATGEGGPKNYQEAARWWRLAAAQGNRQAIEGLEILRTHGALADEQDVLSRQQTQSEQPQ